MTMQPLFSLTEETTPPPTRHPVVGVQKDIRYHGTTARGILNPPDTTGMGFWSINPYVGCAFGCAYCYARYAHRFVMERAAAHEAAHTDAAADETSVHDLSVHDRQDEALPPWLAFERRIFVKHNAADLLRQALRGRGDTAGALRRGEPIVIGTATDPYQPAERTFRVTRSVLEVLADAKRLRLVIITKSPLVTRDIDLLVRIAQRSRLTVHLSLITLDRELARRIEPRAPTPEARLRALTRLREAGLDVGINIMPVLPGITDRPDALLALVRRVATGGASHVNACALRLRATSRKTYLPWIRTEFPELGERYARAYGNDHQIHDRYREGLRRFLTAACRKAGIPYGSPEERAFVATGRAHERRRIVAAGRAGDAWEAGTEDTPDVTHDEQLELAMPNPAPPAITLGDFPNVE
jgi:DNA repair photolyase